MAMLVVHTRNTPALNSFRYFYFYAYLRSFAIRPGEASA
jgi:hypothetical protein